MLSIDRNGVTLSEGGLSRREFLRVGAVGTLGLTLADLLRERAHAGGRRGKARSVIQVWMWGGPPHIDTFDPKPDAGAAFCGPLSRPATTSVAGLRIGQLLPLLAQQAKRYSLVRSLTHGNGGHETAAYMMLSGTMPSSELVYPSIGSVVAYKKKESGYRGVLPPFISIPSAYGRFSEAGFLGNDYRTFATGGNPSAKELRVQGLVAPPGVSEDRQRKRRSLLASVDNLSRTLEGDRQLETLGAYQQAAYDLILGDAKKAFDLSLEKDAVRDRYGRTTNGQSCLLARRLVEQGVPFVTINWGGWDTHTDHFTAMNSALPALDRCLSVLLQDLDERGLLDTTIVTCFGEFGRTPRVDWTPPWNGGRHHHGDVFSALVAGGGFRGGAVLGASDERGEQVRDRPVYPWDLSATMYQLLGIDPHGRLPHPRGCVARVTPLSSGEVRSGGLLHELT